LVSQSGHQLPLYRQSTIFERSGLDLDRSTLAVLGRSADRRAFGNRMTGRLANHGWASRRRSSNPWPPPSAATIGRQVLAGQPIFADDTPITLQAPGNGRTKTARIWTCVPDERPRRGLLAASLPGIASKTFWPSIVGHGRFHRQVELSVERQHVIVPDGKAPQHR
jgi:hypothetical protein